MNKIFVFIFLIVVPFVVSAQYKVSGFVKDAQTGELLVGATVVELNTLNGTVSSTNGYFSLIAKGKQLSVSYVGYQPVEIIYSADTLLSILLNPGSELEMINVSGQRYQSFNTSRLQASEILAIPAIGGKPDIMKTLQLMPGIQSQGEGTSLLNVRGGNPGENLYLIDDVPLLYVNHLGGFMSVFNPDMINSIEVYKGGFPARYGGKLSSIMAISQREGNNKQWKGNMGLGITDASFNIEGPIVKNKATIIVNGRKTLIDPLMLLGSGLADQDFFISYGFHDINSKISYRPNTKNSFHLNFYQGDDYLKFSNKKQENNNEHFKLNNVWGNWLLSGRWSSVLGARLFANHILSYTSYRLKVYKWYLENNTNNAQESEQIFRSTVSDLSFRSDWQFKLTENYSLEYGGKLTRMNHMPNYVYNSSSNNEADFDVLNSFETSAYLNNKILLFGFIDADLGVRMVNYRINEFSTFDFEPRLNITGQISTNHSFNVTYQKMNQYSHLLWTTGAIMNNEVWIPSDDDLSPSKSVQYTLGWKGLFDNGRYETEIVFYNKQLSDLAAYKEGYSNLIGGGEWQTKIEKGGSGKSAGLEMLIRKKLGDWTGFVAYTYSNTTRIFENINRGESFVFDYDRPHSASVHVNHKFGKKWSAGASWIYQTGLPYTPVIGRQYILEENGETVEGLIYGKRNSGRMKEYHRLDLGATYNTTNYKGRKVEWNFSLYNAYCRRNPNAYYYGGSELSTKTQDYDGNYQHIKLYQVSFFPIIPSVSYKVYFN